MAARLLLLLATFACARASMLTAKGYYCQDPDTGLLYSVNTTWPSKSFCGNYTCRIRVKEQDSAPVGSRTIINITRHNPKDKHKDIPKAAENNNVKYKLDDNLLYHINNANNANFKSIVENSADDRYLNSEEIQKISELLHTVKKSDLEAIIEIYNLAQEIYREMDENPTDGSTEPLNSPTEKDLDRYGFEKTKGFNLGHTSYWYEPLSENGFRKTNDLKPDMDSKAASTKAYDTTVYTTTLQPTQPTFFKGAATKSHDIGKLAYYYPMSNFQRLASYYHQRPMYDAHSPHVRAPCNPCTMQQYPPVYGRRPYYPPQKPSLPSMLLPYPFSYQPYNISAYGYSNYNYYKGNPWAYYDYYRSNPYQILSAAGRVQKKSIAANTDTSESKEGDKKSVDNGDTSSMTEKSNSNTKPWQTESLTEADLADVRANIAERAKLLKIPLKKRIKLERVAKVIKLDHLNRQKREAEIVQESPKDDTKKEVVELYIEKTMCTSSTEPGYFRVGNMSQPFPECCPQKIEGSD
ncbi:uncharacterized protein [Choristoneura fumiferana]|uniref:uncharacterized protein n=1 Tax=Choristoneura fumiferana TaxID=7141 RepID=UPI003D154494